MKVKIKWIVAVLSIVVLCGAIYLFYGYLYKDARDISAEAPSYSFTSAGLINNYTRDAQQADSLYTNKALEVKGKVTQVMDSVLVLDSVIVCSLNEKANVALLNSGVTLKGRCIGYDELFSEVKLDQCAIKQ